MRLPRPLFPPLFPPLLSLLLSLSFIAHAAAEERVFLAPADFLAAAFGAAKPQVRMLWLTRDLRAEAARILGHEPAQLRLKYWSDGEKTAWILDEIGKEDPITAGFVVKGGRIEQVRVLTYRESRGGEVRLPGFLAQFQGAGLKSDRQLDKAVDGISGATLSVNAMVRMSRAALLFDKASR